AAEGQVRLGARGRVVDRDHAGAHARAEAEGPLGIVRVDRRGHTVAVRVRQLDRLVEVAEAGDAHDRPERLRAVDLVLDRHPVDDRRVAEQAGVRGPHPAAPIVGWKTRPASGSPTKPARGLSEVILPVEVEPETEWWSRISSSQPRK